MTQEQINKINKLAPMEWQDNEQGIFTQPWGVTTSIKEPVVYMRYETGGYQGGSYHEDSYARPYTKDNIPDFTVLDLVIKELKPSITYLEYKDIEKLIHTNEETEYEYYGNSTDFMVKYIILSELEEKLKL